MTIYDIPNIRVEEIGNPVIAYRINAEEGYVLKLPSYPENVYKSAEILTLSYDFSTVQVIPRTDLPEGAEIYGNTGNDHVIA